MRDYQVSPGVQKFLSRGIARKNADRGDSRLSCELHVQGMIADHRGIGWVRSQCVERRFQMVRMGFDADWIFARQYGLTIVIDVGKYPKKGRPAVSRDDAGPDEAALELAEKHLCRVKKFPFLCGFDLSGGDQRMGCTTKGGCLFRVLCSEKGACCIDHLQDMKFPDPLRRDPVPGDQIQNVGPHSGEIDIQLGQCPIEIEHNGLPRCVGGCQNPLCSLRYRSIRFIPSLMFSSELA
jgi:hypothetical protein